MYNEGPLCKIPLACVVLSHCACAYHSIGISLLILLFFYFYYSQLTFYTRTEFFFAFFYSNQGKEMKSVKIGVGEFCLSVCRWAKTSKRIIGFSWKLKISFSFGHRPPRKRLVKILYWVVSKGTEKRCFYSVFLGIFAKNV